MFMVNVEGNTYGLFRGASELHSFLGETSFDPWLKPLQRRTSSARPPQYKTARNGDLNALHLHRIASSALVWKALCHLPSWPFSCLSCIDFLVNSASCSSNVSLPSLIYCFLYFLAFPVLPLRCSICYSIVPVMYPLPPHRHSSVLFTCERGFVALRTDAALVDYGNIWRFIWCWKF